MCREGASGCLCGNKYRTALTFIFSLYLITIATGSILICLYKTSTQYHWGFGLIIAGIMGIIITSVGVRWMGVQPCQSLIADYEYSRIT